MRGCTNLQGDSSGSFKDLPDTLLALGRALEEGKGIDLLRHLPPLLRLDWLLFLFAQFLDCVGVVAEVLKTKELLDCCLCLLNSYLLVSNEDDGKIGSGTFAFAFALQLQIIGAEAFDLRCPLLIDILQ